MSANKNRIYQLEQELTAIITDDTSHYFGGYYHVKLSINVEIPLQLNYFTTTSEYDEACKKLGNSTTFSRTLEKMAVHENEQESVKQQLLKDFEQNLLPYLSHANFAAGAVRKAYLAKTKKRTALYSV